MQYRLATLADVELLAELNARLIRDENHRNRMARDQLAARMRSWLSGEYRAALFVDGVQVAGYALWRAESDYVYLRQFYVSPTWRRRGIGRGAMAVLRGTYWSNATRIRIDVLVGNSVAVAFWRAQGFRDYCLTMELDY